jgi:hypothetical protein
LTTFDENFGDLETPSDKSYDLKDCNLAGKGSQKWTEAFEAEAWTTVKQTYHKAIKEEMT